MPGQAGHDGEEISPRTSFGRNDSKGIPDRVGHDGGRAGNDSRDTTLVAESVWPIIMNAVRDEDGNMVATDVIEAASITARFRNVAERAGYVSVGFDVIVPEEMHDSRWQLRIFPYMTMKGDRTPLDAIYVTGQKYRAAQIRGYERYRRFLASIISDTTEFIRVRQLEICLKRNFPETYAMKTDTSLVSEPMAENLFGVTQVEALRHYTDKWSIRNNEKRKARSGTMYRRFVKDPLVKEGIRLDTVILSNEGTFIYRYIHNFSYESSSCIMTNTRR